ncbi:MAG TPA: hypothetical protein VME63_03345 [Dyella sp.]|uniref:hypothetical protein n=1 Tax=Dyella sp. TaxID=1869338 RepID=UPI002D0C1AA0|nr:hypothetical protein [Dyella sp.]HTV84410.1 hypothetical protein [Dyella sp.]
MTRTHSPWREAVAVNITLLRQHCRDPWVVIGSTAAALAGADVTVADLDVLTSTDDATRLIDMWNDWLDTAYCPEGDDRFRSRFARFRFADGMPLEVMGDLELHGFEGWQPVQVTEIVQVYCAGVSAPIPAIAEQIRMLENFARPKDLLRAQLLRAL